MALTDANPAFAPSSGGEPWGGGIPGLPMGSEFDGYAKFRAIFGKSGKTAKRSHFGPPRPPESDSRPHFYTERTKNQLIWSILEPFREDFLPNRAKSEPNNLGGTWPWILAFFSMEDPGFSRFQKGSGNVIFG